MGFKLSKTWQAIDNILSFLSAVATGDDAGLVCLGQFSVGTPDNPKESVFGGGDSYPVPIAFHATIANTSGLTITNAIDRQATLASDTASTAALFNGTAAGNYLLVGSSSRYGGAKAKISTAGIIEPDNVVVEYLSTDTPTWIAQAPLSTDGDTGISKADELAVDCDCSEQWRIGFDPESLPVIWEPVTMTINGTEYIDYYWARFRITDTITTDAILEQLKLHTNRFEINPGGNTEYFGSARYPKDLLVNWASIQTLQGFAPASENIDFASNLSLVYTLNKLVANKVDGIGGFIIIPTGMDTSINIVLSALWVGLSDSAGDIEFEVLYKPKRVGDLMDTSETATSILGTINVSAGEQYTLYSTQVTLDARKLKPGEIMGFAIKRLGTETSDTYGDLALMNVRAVGRFYQP